MYHDGLGLHSDYVGFEFATGDTAIVNTQPSEM